MKRKQRSGSTSGPGAPAAASGACKEGGVMSLVRLRAIEHGVEENDLASVNGIGELLPLLAALKEGHAQVGQRRRKWSLVVLCRCVWRAREVGGGVVGWISDIR